MGNYLISKKILEGKLLLFCSPKRGAESEMKCLLLRLKSLSARGASRHPAFMCSCPTLNHRCVNLIILVDEFFFIFSVLVSLKDMRTRRGSVIYCVWSAFR